MHVTIPERSLLQAIREHNRGDDPMAALASMCIHRAHLGFDEAVDVISSLTEKGFITVVVEPLSSEPVDDIRFHHERMTLTLTKLGWQECHDKMIGDRTEAETKLTWYARSADK